MKLGELLVNAGKLTQAEVEETLKGQAIFRADPYPGQRSLSL